MTSKPDSVGKLGCHWTDHTGRPLEPQVHLNATGTTLADASAQWCSSGDLVLICIIGTHWKTTGATSTLGCHWNHTGWCYHPVVSQWRSSVNLHNWNTLEDHWKATGRPLEHHWKHTGISPVAFQCTLGSEFQAHWIATGLPLEDHWLRVRDSLQCVYVNCKPKKYDNHTVASRFHVSCMVTSTILVHSKGIPCLANCLYLTPFSWTSTT